MDNLYFVNVVIEDKEKEAFLYVVAKDIAQVLAKIKEVYTREYTDNIREIRLVNHSENSVLII
jgi:hypothetical protein